MAPQPSHQQPAWQRRLWAAWFEKQPLPWWVRLMTGLLSRLYGAVMSAKGTPPRGKSSVGLPVIVVGNILVGGAGKTPIVAALCKALSDRGYRPGVITRGYKREHKSDHNQPTGLAGIDVIGPATVLDAQAARRFGDEPVWLVQNTRCPVAIGRQRNQALQALSVAYPEVNVVISDDGLQHQPLLRVFEMAVFDDRGYGNGQLLPAGPLREPITRLQTVDAIVFSNGQPKAFDLPAGTTTPQYASILNIVDMHQWATGMRMPVAQWVTRYAGQQPPLQPIRITAMAGMGHPEKFFRLLNTLGISAHTLPLPDHFEYPSDFLERLGTDLIVTTGKDAVKLHKNDQRVWVLDIAASLPDTLIQHIEEHLLGP